MEDPVDVVPAPVVGHHELGLGFDERLVGERREIERQAVELRAVIVERNILNGIRHDVSSPVTCLVFNLDQMLSS